MRQGPSATIEDWHRIREILLAEEAKLDLLAMQVEAGQASKDALDEQREQVLALRELCEVVLGRLLKEDRQARRSANAYKRPVQGSQPPGTMRADHTILVVDDHAPTLYTATRLLTVAGFRVLEASTGREAMLLSDKASALLLDVNLPDINGVAVCQAVKRSCAKPVVLMSAVYVDELHRSAGLSAGADLYLTSLLEGEQLASSFDKLLLETAAS